MQTYLSDRLCRHSGHDPHLAPGILGTYGVCHYRRVAGRDAGHTHGTARVVQSVITVGGRFTQPAQRIEPGLC